jgi:hypothetical protein
MKTSIQRDAERIYFNTIYFRSVHSREEVNDASKANSLPWLETQSGAPSLRTKKDVIYAPRTSEAYQDLRIPSRCAGIRVGCWLAAARITKFYAKWMRTHLDEINQIEQIT